MQFHDSIALDGARASSLAESQLFQNQGIAYDDLVFTAVLPEQFYSTVLPSAQQSGHIALRCAVLADALNCLIKASKKDGNREQRLAKETAEWVFTDEFDWPFSFVNICMVLRIDPAYIRRGLLRWMQRGSGERRPRPADEEVVVSLRQRTERARGSSAHSTSAMRRPSTPGSRAERSDQVALST